MKKIEEVQKIVEKDVLGLGDVTGVYIGEKDNKESIIVNVKKMSPNTRKLIPRQVEGYNIEVEDVGEQPSIDW
jgi:hypothetical protein